VPAKRNDRVAPPGPPDGWTARFATNEAAKGWEDLVSSALSNTWEAYVVLTTRPTQPENPRRQHRLKGGLSTHVVKSKTLEQWQYEVTGGDRIWYCPDPDIRTVWLVYAGPHPKATD
jgi:hypothetical protein